MTDLGTFLEYTSEGQEIILSLCGMFGAEVDRVKTSTGELTNFANIGVKSLDNEDKFYNTSDLINMTVSFFGSGNHYLEISVGYIEDIPTYKTQEEAEKGE